MWVPVGIFCATHAENIKALTLQACHKTFQFSWHLSRAVGLRVVFLGELMKGLLAKQACLAWSYSPLVVSVSQERKPKESEKSEENRRELSLHFLHFYRLILILLL